MPVRDLLSAASTQGAAPSDPNFENVSLLLSGDGTNGAQNNTFLDSSTNNFTITRNGNTTQGSFSPYGSLWSNYFGAGDTSLSTSSTSNLQLGSSDFTVEGWVYNNSFGSAGSFIMGKWSYPNKSYYLGYNASNLYFGVSTDGQNDTAQLNASVSLAVNTWYHIAAVRSGNTLYFYVNGTQVGTASCNFTFYSGSAPLVTGGMEGGGTAWQTFGYISNARLVIGSAVYTAAFTPSTTPLTAITNTRFLTSQSNRFIDNSTNNAVISVYSGSPSVQRFSPFNPTAPYSTSVIGGSGYFDGSGDYLTSVTNAAFNFGSGAFTIEAFYYTTSTGNQVIISAWNGSGGGNDSTSAFEIIYFSGVLYCQVASGTSATSLTTSTWPVNQWNHVVLVANGSTMSAYLNGTRFATTSFSSAVNDAAYAPQIGTRSPSSSFPFVGYISNARIVKGTAVYDPTSSTLTVPTAPLTNITNTSLLTSMTNAGIPDLAMQNNLETVGNAQVSTSVKKYGTGSLAFDGSGDYLLSAATQVIAASRFTVEAWLYKSSTNEKYAIAQGTSGNAGRFAIGVASTNWFVQIGSASVNAGSVSTNTWTHIAVTYDGATLTLYVNGTSVGTASTTQAVQNTTLRLGTLGADWSTIYEWDGYMDDIRITNGVIRYTTTFTPPASALPTF